MPLPTIADTYRIAINWGGGDSRKATNVIHVLAPTSTETDVADLVIASFEADMWNTVWDDATIDELVVTKLDGTPDGNVFGRAYIVAGNTGGAAASEGSGGTQYNPQVAALVKLQTAASGRSGRGRVFLPWTAEAAQANGFIEATNRANVTSGWVNFSNDLVAGGMALAVASYVNSSASQVLNLACELATATQRKRNNR